MTRSVRALVGLTCCVGQGDDFPRHSVSEKYIAAVLETVEAVPVLIPSLGGRLPIEALLDRLDGLVFTGSPSNIEPHHYAGSAPPDNNPIDPARDASTLALIRAAAARSIPIFGICRGLQEINVALGGTLAQEVHRVQGRFDHRQNEADPLSVQYGPAHPVQLVAGGLLSDLLDGADEIMVNSLHGQGIERLAPGLVVEAVASDGQIEAVRGTGIGFCLAVQWHPEYRAAENPVSRALFQAFGEACWVHGRARDPASVIAPRHRPS